MHAYLLYAHADYMLLTIIFLEAVFGCRGAKLSITQSLVGCMGWWDLVHILQWSTPLGQELILRNCGKFLNGL